MEDNRAVRRIAAAEDIDEVLSIARAFYRLHGFEALSYARPSHDTPGRTDMLFRGFPEAWVSSYREGLDRLDPFPALAARSGRPLRYSVVMQGKPLAGDLLHFIEQARAHGVTDGYIFPTFGPRQHLAAIGITMADHPDRVDHADVPVLHCVAQAAHLRIDQFEEDVVERPRLAPREVTILHWIARGKSNEEIAMILGSKRPTIATHIKRIFIKLNVSDRAAAAVKGLKFGLINV
jgi:DNA-binding CsgD family transcriptional regulator